MKARNEDISYNKTEHLSKDDDNQNFFNEVGKFLTCQKCKGIVIDPRECSVCRTSYCFECFDRKEANKRIKITCPNNCKNTLVLPASELFIRNLTKLRMNCQRCKKEINCNELEQHERKTCEKRMIQCNNQGCIQEFEYDFKFAHHSVCEFALIKCEECGQGTLRKNKKNLNEERNNELHNYFSEIVNLKDRLKIKENENNLLIMSKDILENEIKKLQQEILITKEFNDKSDKRKGIDLFDKFDKQLIKQETLCDQENSIQIKFEEKIEDFVPRIISEMFQIIKNGKNPVIMNPILDILNNMDIILKKTGQFLDYEQIKSFFKKLLTYHKEKFEKDHPVEKLITTIFETHRELFESDEELTFDILYIFFEHYSFENYIIEEEINRGIKILIIIFSQLGKIGKIFSHPENDKYMYKEKIMKILLSLIKYDNPSYIINSCILLKNIQNQNYPDFKLYTNEILNAIINKISYSFDYIKNLWQIVSKNRMNSILKKQIKDWESAKDESICLMGNIIYYQNTLLELRKWVPIFMSYFPLDSRIRQNESYKLLCRLLVSENSKVFLGNNNEYLEKVYKILDFVYGHLNIFDTPTSQSIKKNIETFFQTHSKPNLKKNTFGAY